MKNSYALTAPVIQVTVESLESNLSFRNTANIKEYSPSAHENCRETKNLIYILIDRNKIMRANNNDPAVSKT